jgi:ABC-type glycerol-3-phosphate transport system permease component
MRIRASRRAIVAIYAGYALVLMVFVAPALWVLSLSLRPLNELLVFPPGFVPGTSRSCRLYRRIN